MNIIKKSLCLVLALSLSTLAEPTAQPTGFIQLQAYDDASTPKTTEFLIKRARFGFKGSVAEDIRYNIVVGLSEGSDDSPKMVNAFIDLDHLPNHQVRIGQFLLPFGLEGRESITINPAIERSQTIRNLNPFSMFRDAGIQISHRNESYSYAVALVNGTGANTRDDNRQKDFLGHATYSPISNLELGASYHTGQFLSGGTNLSRNSYGIDFDYTVNENYRWRGEFMSRSDDTLSGEETQSQGYYLLTTYALSETVKTVLRFEQYDPNTDSSNDTLTITTLGLNYQLSPNTEWAINYELREDDADATVGNRLTTQLQLKL